MFEGKPTPKPTQENMKFTAEVDLDNLFPDFVAEDSRVEGTTIRDSEVTDFINSLQYAGNEAVPLEREEIVKAEVLEVDLKSKKLSGELFSISDIREIGRTLAALEKLKINSSKELSVEQLQKIKNIEIRLRSIRDQETETA